MRSIMIFLAVVLILCAGIYFSSDIILEKTSDKAIDYIMAKMKIPGFEYSRPQFDSVRLSSIRTITWSGITFDLQMMTNIASKENERFSVKVDELSISLASIRARIIQLRARGLRAEEKDLSKTSWDSAHVYGDLLEAKDFGIQIKLNSMRPEELLTQARELAAEMKKFLQTGVTKLPIKFSGAQTIVLNGQPYRLRVWVQPDGGGYRLVMDEAGVRQIGNLGGKIRSTPGDIKIIALNPLKASQLLRIREQAEAAAGLAHKNNPKVPEDAYRHTLWSYLLTKAFGEAFAKEVADAHELVSDSEEAGIKDSRDKRAAREQDYNNNAMGREYAVKGYPESMILKLVMTDRSIVRDGDLKKR